MASYAKQAKDDSLLQIATRIKARAERRLGELLKEIEPQQGANQNIRAGARPKVQTRKAAAADAGVSEFQAKQAIRVANVPAETFEKLVESDSPPTISALAEMGTKKAEERPSAKRLVRHCRIYGIDV